MFINVTLSYDLIAVRDPNAMPPDEEDPLEWEHMLWDGDVVASMVRTYSSDNLSYITPYFCVQYPKVTRYEYKDSIFRARTVSDYEIQDQYKVGDMSMENVGYVAYFPLIYNTSHTEKNIKEYRLGYKPLLWTRTVYDDNNRPVKTEEFDYEKSVSPTNKSFLGLRISQGVDLNVEDMRTNPNIIGGHNINLVDGGIVQIQFNRMLTEIKIGTDLLKSKWTYTLDKDNYEFIETIENYEYDEKNRHIKSEIINSNEDIVTKELIYPAENTELNRRNMVSTIVETVLKKNNTETGRRKDIYTNNSILPLSVQTSIKGGNMDTEIVYNEYDIKGNIIQYTDRSNISNVILWSYNNRYPILEIKNATYEEVRNSIREQLYVQVIGDADPDDEKIFTLGTVLREALPNAEVTTITYKPLIGMTSQTDPRGGATYYDYDDLGRLKEVYRIEGNKKKILKKYNYHYAD